ncbi:MAG: hypothetical protein K9W44_03170 [Candidatus Lokiarchaeota archaeon]|nr:hypothetical protein [Candidatus Harpocratesius repetitus]
MNTKEYREKKTGVLDFVYKINQWPYFCSIWDAGEVLERRDFSIDFYGKLTNEHTGNQLRENIPVFLTGFSQYWKYYKQLDSFIGNDAPASPTDSMFPFIIAQCYAFLPEVQAEIETNYLGLYAAFEGVPLRIALFMLKSDIKLPEFDWTAEHYTGKRKTFAECSGYSNEELVKETLNTYFVIDISSSPSYSLVYNNEAIEQWMEMRKIIHDILATGLSYEEISKNPQWTPYLKAVRLLFLHMTISAPEEVDI